MAKGQISKDNIAKELLAYFGDRAFKYDKEIRVNCQEAGELVQIKIALTAAKVAVTEGGDEAMPGDIAIAPQTESAVMFNAKEQGSVAQPTETEKHNVAELLKSLGL